MIKLAYTGTTRLQNILTPYQPYGDPDMGKAIPQIRDNPPHLLIIHAPEPVYPIYGTPIEQIITELADNGTTVIVIQPDGAENIATGLPHTIYLTPQDDLAPYLIVAGLTPQHGTALTIEEPEPEPGLESVEEPELGLVGEPGLESVEEPEPESVGEPEPGLESVEEPETEYEVEPGVESITVPETEYEVEFESETVTDNEPGVEPGFETVADTEYEADSETVWADEPEAEPTVENVSDIEYGTGGESEVGSGLGTNPATESVSESDMPDWLPPESDPGVVLEADPSVALGIGTETGPVAEPGTVSDDRGEAFRAGDQGETTIVPETENDPETESVTETEFEVGTEIESVGEFGSGAGNGSVGEPVWAGETAPWSDSGSEFENGASSDSGPEFENGASSDSGPEFENGASSDSGPEFENGASSDSGPEFENGARSDSEPVWAVESESDSAAASGVNAGAGTVEELEPVQVSGADPGEESVWAAGLKPEAEAEAEAETVGETVSEVGVSWPVLDTVDGSGVTPVAQLEFVTGLENEVTSVDNTEPGLIDVVDLKQESVPEPEQTNAMVQTDSFGVEADENSYLSGQALDEKSGTAAKLGTALLNVEDDSQRVVSAEEFLSMTEPEPGSESEPEPGSESEPESEPEPIVAVEPEPISDSIPTTGLESMPTVETGHVSESVTESVSESVFESVFEPTPGVEATANGDTPDWLTPEPAPVAEPTPENNTPDWLTPESVSDPVFEPAADPVFEAATDNKTPEPAPASTPSFEASDGNNNPSWLTPETTPVVEATADSTPNWLTQPIAEPASDFTPTVEPETMPVIEPAPVVEPAPENDTPDWLAPEPTSESAPAPENGNNTPGWLTPGSTPVVEPMSENSTPGWLATEPISEPVSNPATVVEPVPETISGLVSEPVFESTVENDTPDWLTPTPVVEPAPENSTPDWLNPESVAEPKPDFMSTVETETMPTVEAESALEPATDNTPNWLTQPASEPTPVAEATSDSTPDWLTQPESATVVEPAPENSTPDWLTPESVSNPATVVEPMSEPVSDPTLIDTPQNWTTTTTTAQNTPDWVKQKTQNATTPTPTTTTVTTLTTPTRPTIPTITSTRHALATLISAKGGVGKTLLTITLADTAVRYGPGGYRVSIIDANRGQADIGPYLNLPETTPSIYQTTQNHNPLLQHLTPNRINQYRQGLGDVGYAVTLAPPTDLSDPHLIDTSLYTETINTITENSNLTLIDTATTENYDTTSLIEDVVIPATLNHAGWIIAVTDTSRTGATNLAKRLNQYFMKGVSPAKTIIVINQATTPNDPAYQQATKTLQPLGTPIITIPHSSLVYQLSAQARMATSAPNMAPPLQQVLATVTGQPGFVNNTNPTPTTVTAISSPKAGNKSGFFNKLFK